MENRNILYKERGGVMNARMKKRAKTHHIITMTFCYLPFVWILTLWLMRLMRLNYRDTSSFVVPFAIENILFIAYCTFSDDLEKMEAVLQTVARLCPISFIPLRTQQSQEEQIVVLKRTLYSLRATIFIVLGTTVPWNGVRMNIYQCLVVTLATNFLVVLQSTYYLVLYYEMLRTFLDKSDD